MTLSYRSDAALAAMVPTTTVAKVSRINGIAGIARKNISISFKLIDGPALSRNWLKLINGLHGC